MEGNNDIAVRATGGQAHEIVIALIDSAYDKEVSVRSVISKSLRILGHHQPSLVLSSCHGYLDEHLNLPQSHRVVLLDSMRAIIQDNVSQLDEELACALIRQASADLTYTDEVLPEWQTAASGMLVALGATFCHHVMAELQTKFQPGVLPHFFVVQTMADLASSTVYAMVPFLKVVLGTMLPMMGLAKQDNIRWVFSFGVKTYVVCGTKPPVFGSFSPALCKFSEAILEYVANIEKAPDASVTKEFFTAEIDVAYDVLLNSWLNSKDVRLRAVVMEALGQMSQIISQEKLATELQYLLSVFVGLYRRHVTDSYNVTLGLGLILDAASTSCPSSLEQQLEPLLSALFPQMCQPVDFRNSLTVKNHNELLRCYTTLADHFSARLVPHLLTKLEGGNERVRIATVCILRHLVNSVNDQLEDKRAVILGGLNQLLNDPSNKVKKELAQTVMAMSHHGYMEMEGGEKMIEFVVRQCCPGTEPVKRPSEIDYVSSEALRSMCENVLQLMSTTVDNMGAVLWPYLLEFLIPEEFSEAVGVVCKCLADITIPNQDTEGTELPAIDYKRNPNLPKPPQIIARLFVMAGRAGGGRARGVNALQALLRLAPHLGDHLYDVWQAPVNSLLQKHAAPPNDETWNQTKWEKRVLDLMKITIEQMNSEAWTVSVGEALGQQLVLYNSLHEEKNFAFKLLGFVMMKSKKKDFIQKHLSVIMSSVKHTDNLEQEGCAVAMGYVGSHHLDTVLFKLENVVRSETKGKTGLLNFIKESVGRSELDDKVKATIIRSYGHVALYASPSVVTSYIDTIVKAIDPYFGSAKDIHLRQILIKTTDMIGCAMHPEHLMMRHDFTQRGDLLNYMQNYLKMESPAALVTVTRSLALKACAPLVMLDPMLSENDIDVLLNTALNCFIPLPVGGINVPRPKEETYEELIHKEMLMSCTKLALEKLLCELIRKCPTPGGLENIFKHLHPWSLSLESHERERALLLTLTIFAFYLDNLHFTIGNSGKFMSLGTLLGRIVPRCTDAHLGVRQTAVACIYTLLRIALRYQGNNADYTDPHVEALIGLKEQMEKNDNATQLKISKEIAETTSCLVSNDQLLLLLEKLYEALEDPHPESSYGACLVLNAIIKARGSAVSNEVETMLNCLLNCLPLVQNSPTYDGTLQAVQTLASHHLLSTMTVLLNYPLPFSRHVMASWQEIAAKHALVPSMMAHLLDVLARSLPYEEQKGLRERDPVTRIATPLPLAATCVLAQLFSGDRVMEGLAERLPVILGAVMVRTASSVGVKPPVAPLATKNKPADKSKGKASRSASLLASSLDPCGLAVQALRGLLVTAGGQVVVDGLEKTGSWNKFQDTTAWPEAFTVLTRLIVQHQPQHMCKLVNVLNPTLASIYEPQRIMVAAVFAELINQQCAGDLALVELMINSLLGRLVDQSHLVRRLCIRGLGNVASVGCEQAQRHSTTVLSAMMAGMDDKEDMDDEITLEAMGGLSRILAQIDETHIRAILINIALRIRPCFEKEKASVRAAAFTLFGDLARFGDGPSKSPFLEQVHTNFVALLLHLHDREPSVRKACKYALRLLGPLLGSDVINTMFQRHLPEDATLLYGAFINDLSKAMIADFPDKLNFYVLGNVTFFRSRWAEIQSNAAMFVGSLLGNAPLEAYADISREHVCSALVMLLKDISPEVRINAVEAMSRLHNF